MAPSSQDAYTMEPMFSPQSSSQDACAMEPMYVPLPADMMAPSLCEAEVMAKSPAGPCVPLPLRIPLPHMGLEHGDAAPCEAAPAPEIFTSPAPRKRVPEVSGSFTLAGARPAPKLACEGQNIRWWTMHDPSLMCPFSAFPICLLPYPPFKLRVQAHKSHPHILVDGKFLAMSFIASGSAVIDGRRLEDVQVVALEKYMYRCKLGRFRPRRALDLAKDAANPELSEEQQNEASQELARLRAAAEWQLGKIQLVQKNRRSQLRQELSAVEETADQNGKHEETCASPRGGSDASTISCDGCDACQ